VGCKGLSTGGLILTYGWHPMPSVTKTGTKHFNSKPPSHMKSTMEISMNIELNLDIYTVIIDNITSIETLNALRCTCRWFRNYVTKRRVLDVVITNILYNEDFDPSETILKRPLVIGSVVATTGHITRDPMQFGDLEATRHFTSSFKAHTVNAYAKILEDKINTHDCFIAIERTLVTKGEPDYEPAFGNIPARPKIRTYATSLQPIGNVTRSSMNLLGNLIPTFGSIYNPGDKSFESNLELEDFLMSEFEEVHTHVDSFLRYGGHACQALCENKKDEYMDRLNLFRKDFNYKHCVVPQSGPHANGFEELEDDDLINFRYMICIPSYFLRGYVDLLPTAVNDMWLTSIRLICIEKNPGPFASIPVQNNEVRANLLPLDSTQKTNPYSITNNRKERNGVESRQSASKSTSSVTVKDSSPDSTSLVVADTVRADRSSISRDEVKTSNKYDRNDPKRNEGHDEVKTSNKYYRDHPKRYVGRERHQDVTRREYRPRDKEPGVTNEVTLNPSCPPVTAAATSAAETVVLYDPSVNVVPDFNSVSIAAPVTQCSPSSTSVDSSPTLSSSNPLSTSAQSNDSLPQLPTGSVVTSTSSTSTCNVKPTLSASILASVTQPAAAKVDVLTPLPDSGPKVVIDIKDPEATALLALVGIKELVNDLHIRLYNVPTYEVTWTLLRYTLLILFLLLELDVMIKVVVCVLSHSRIHVLDVIFNCVCFPILLLLHFYAMKAIPHKHLIYSAKLVSLRVSETLQKEYFKTGKEIPDLRPDAIAQTKLKHQELIDAVFLYTQHGWNNFFCFSYVANSRRLDVSLEAFVQIAHAKNLSLMLNDKDAWYSFYHSAQSTQTINLDKNQVLQNKLTIQDTCIIADLKYREMHQRRGWMAFPKPV
jgi:hypothetical protein